MSVDDIAPVTRREIYLARIAGQDVELPPPLTREEIYLDEIARHGGGSGLPDVTSEDNGKVLAVVDGEWGLSDDTVEQAVADWLEDHPEATTTVEDGSITNAKLASSFVTPGMASAYSSSSTYAVGDYVFYNGALYRCKTAISTAEAWTAAHWTAVTLGGDVERINAVVEETTQKSPNLMPIEAKTRTVNDVSVSYADGSIVLDGTANASGGRLSSVTPAFSIASGTYTISVDSLAKAAVYLEKASNNGIVAGLSGTTLVAQFTLAEETSLYVGVNLESGKTYDGTIKLQIEKSGTASDWVAPSKVYGYDSIARGGVEDIGGYSPVELTWTSGKAYIYNSGWTNNTGYSYADVNLKQGQGLYVKNIRVNNAVYPISVWSEDGNTLIKACFGLISGDAQYKDYVYVCSKQSERVRINVDSSYKSNLTALLFSVNDIVNKSNIEAENCYEFADVLYDNIIAIGDSLTQGSYTGADLHTSQSYPAFLAKMMGVTVENAGRSGWSTLQWYTGDAETQKGFPYYDYTDYDTAVICLGTNGGLTDTLATDVDPYESYTDYASTNTGAYCAIIEGMRAQNAGINILLCNVWGASDTSTTNTVIEKIAQRYGLTVIDLRNEFRNQYGAYHATQGNIHLGRIGYAKMAGIIRAALEKQVYVDPTNYNYIPS